MFKHVKKIATLSLLLLISLPLVAQEMKVDPLHSFVRFDIDYGNIARVYGSFRDVSGTVFFDEEDLASSSISVTVKADSIFTGVKDRDDHLRSPDFFNVKQHPLITFASKSFIKVSDKKYTVTGDLQLLGVTKEVTAEFTVLGKAESVMGAEAILIIKRSEYGMKFMLDKLGDEVVVEIALLVKG